MLITVEYFFFNAKKGANKVSITEYREKSGEFKKTKETFWNIL